MEPTITEVMHQLKNWFAPEDHQLRDLPGGGKWYFVPWQRIRERLDEAYPDWQIDYTEPSYVGDYCVIACTITIMGRSRKGVGNAPIQLISSTGKDMSRGTPIERATADAFKNAAEAWGVARYLDEQTDPKTKADFIKYMQKAGRGDVALNYHRNEGNLPPKQKRQDPPSKPFGQSPKPASKPAATPPKPAEVPQSAGNAANLNRFRMLTTFMGLGNAGDKAIQRAIALKFPGKKSSDLEGLEVDQVVRQILINYGEPMFSDLEACEITFWQQIVQNESLTTDQAMATAWMELLTKQSKKAG